MWKKVKSKKQKRRKKKRTGKTHNPACLVLDFKKGVNGADVQSRIWSLLHKESNLRITFMRVLDRGGLMLRFKSGGAKCQA